jgi:arginyl-tRNA synthetase
LAVQAQAIGINAVKYADLSCPRQHDYAFSYDRMLKFEGNTALYLMYAYVRIMSIQAKVKTSWDAAKDMDALSVSHPCEMALAIHLIRFSEAIHAFKTYHMPNRLTDYLYELATCFHQFFRDCQVIGHEQEKSRMALCFLTHRVLKQGFDLLGLQLLTTM